MRRRSGRPMGDELPVPPPELRTCYIEDWVSPDEEPPAYLLEPEPWNWRSVVAWRRWRRARTAWLEQNGVPRSRWGELLPSGRPRSRSQGDDQ